MTNNTSLTQQYDTATKTKHQGQIVTIIENGQIETYYADKKGVVTDPLSKQTIAFLSPRKF